ncbi:HipA family kinase [Methylobacterium sp. 1030]|uniref:HipA family kinase n=1 Tax=Methylobacterium sp. 1030 TaxID=3156404 RepID=UPI00339A595A
MLPAKGLMLLMVYRAIKPEGRTCEAMAIRGQATDHTLPRTEESARRQVTTQIYWDCCSQPKLDAPTWLMRIVRGGQKIRANEMGVEAARLASGTIKSNHFGSANTTVIGQLYTTNEPDIKAVVKALSPRQIANELIAAALAEALGLPAPRSFLVFADPADSFSTNNYSHSSGEIIYYGSELSANQTLIAYFNSVDILAFKMIHSYAEWGNLLAFDEWTANSDRHLKNYMYDGSKIILFDHDQCLTGPQWTPSQLVANHIYQCHARILQIHSSMPQDKKDQAAALAGKLETLAAQLDVSSLITSSLASEVQNNIPNDLPAAEKFLKERIPFIQKLCKSRLA